MIFRLLVFCSIISDIFLSEWDSILRPRGGGGFLCIAWFEGNPRSFEGLGKTYTEPVAMP